MFSKAASDPVSVDKFNVTGVLTPASPITGQPMTITITGDDVVTTTAAGTIGPLTAHLVAPDGAVFDLVLPATPYTQISTAHQSVKIASVSDPAGRVWTIAASGLSASALA
jgi:hypothetical protein